MKVWLHQFWGMIDLPLRYASLEELHFRFTIEVGVSNWGDDDDHH